MGIGIGMGLGSNVLGATGEVTLESVMLSFSPAAYWKMNDATNATITDSSGNNYTGTAFGDASTAQQDPTGSGHDGMKIDNEGGFVINDDIIGSGNLTETTVCGWLTPITNGGAIVTARAPNNASNYGLYGANDNVSMDKFPPSGVSLSADPGFSLNERHFFACVESAGSRFVYVDTGIVASSETVETYSGGAVVDKVYLGSNGVSPAGSRDFILDNCAIYSTGLSAAELLSIYNAGV